VDPVEPAVLHLLVMGEGIFTQVPLTSGSQVTIGRGDNAGVRLTDPMASRAHACLHVGDKLLLEDLGSANGTSVRDSKLAPHERREIAPGEPIVIGSTTLMVQRTWTRETPKRLWPHEYFEARLEEECARAARAGSTFAVVRVNLVKSKSGVGVRIGTVR
jgi:hypothetical protein